MDHPVERPPYGEVPEGDLVGALHVREALSDLVFPQTAGDLRARVGHWRIAITGAHAHPLSDFLEGIPDDARFRNANDVARAVRRAERRR